MNDCVNGRERERERETETETETETEIGRQRQTKIPKQIFWTAAQQRIRSQF